MKIIAFSNFDIETVDEWVVADNIASVELGQVMLEALQKTVASSDPYYFKLEADGYKLYVWEP